LAIVEAIAGQTRMELVLQIERHDGTTRCRCDAMSCDCSRRSGLFEWTKEAIEIPLFPVFFHLHTPLPPSFFPFLPPRLLPAQTPWVGNYCFLY